MGKKNLINLKWTLSKVNFVCNEKRVSTHHSKQLIALKINHLYQTNYSIQEKDPSLFFFLKKKLLVFKERQKDIKIQRLSHAMD